MGLATFAGPNLLILDEPTNHLDIDTRAELVHALNEFKGVVILIAHDRQSDWRNHGSPLGRWAAAQSFPMTAIWKPIGKMF